MRISRRWLLFTGFGLLPLWLAIAFVVMVVADNPNNMIAAPWAIIAAIPISGVTLTIAGITSAVYHAASGDESRKRKRAAAVFGLLIVAVLMAIAITVLRYKNKQADLAAEEQAAQRFIENNAQVRAAPISGRARRSSSTLDSSGNVAAYTFSFPSKVDTGDRIKAIVDVDRSSGQAVFNLRCIVFKQDAVRRQIDDKPCPP